MPRILHTADWQIGRQYGRFAPEDALALSEARLTAVERIAALAVDEQVDAIVVAGDVFDAQTVSDRTLLRLFHATQAFDGPWIMIPGNHDAALAESVWARAQRLSAIPAHVHVSLTPETLTFPDIGLALLTAPLTQRHTHHDLTAGFATEETPDTLVRVGLAHGSVQGILADDIDATNPIAPDRAHTAALDYLALGDWHGQKCIDERTWYSGTPEQDRFKDNGAGQVLVVDLALGTLPVVTPHRLGQFRWAQWACALNVASDVDALIERLEGITREAVIEITLTGHIDLTDHQRLGHALILAQGRCRSLHYDMSGLRLEPTDEDLATLHADGYLNDAISELRERQQEDDTAREALNLLAGMLQEASA